MLFDCQLSLTNLQSRLIIFRLSNVFQLLNIISVSIGIWSLWSYQDGLFVKWLKFKMCIQSDYILFKLIYGRGTMLHINTWTNRLKTAYQTSELVYCSIQSIKLRNKNNYAALYANTKMKIDIQWIIKQTQHEAKYVCVNYMKTHYLNYCNNLSY